MRNWFIGRLRERDDDVWPINAGKKMERKKKLFGGAAQNENKGIRPPCLRVFHDRMRDIVGASSLVISGHWRNL